MAAGPAENRTACQVWRAGPKGGITMDMSGRDDGRRFEMSETQEDGTVRTGGGGGTQQGHPPKPKPKPPKK